MNLWIAASEKNYLGAENDDSENVERFPNKYHSEQIERNGEDNGDEVEVNDHNDTDEDILGN
jgi:hypothetical protein